MMVAPRRLLRGLGAAVCRSAVILFTLVVLVAISRAEKPKGTLSPVKTSRADLALVPATFYRRPFSSATSLETLTVAPFRMQKRAITVREFLAFLNSHPEWRRSRIKRLFADSLYLNSWQGDLAPSQSNLNVTQTEVSWFVAEAYCESLGRRLPTTDEWEVAAAAFPLGSDSAAIATRILDWYSHPQASHPPEKKTAGSSWANAYGIQDLFGNVWEWTSDFNSAGRSSDAGSGGSQGLFCGGAGQATSLGVDYPTFMRFSFRSSLQPDFSLKSLGFRCVEDL